jgi:hypothetical protein
MKTKEYKSAVWLYKALYNKTEYEWTHQDLFFEEFMEDELGELDTIMREGLNNESRLAGLKAFQEKHQRFLYKVENTEGDSSSYDWD